MNEKIRKDTDALTRCAEFFFEVKHLEKTMRQGFDHLGEYKQNVSSHSFGVALIGLALAKIEGAIPVRVLIMCLIHDLPEARCGDLSYLQQKYDTRDEKRAFADAVAGLPFESEASVLYEEFERMETLEAKVARDADQIELLASLVQRIENGNQEAKGWIPNVLKRIQTNAGKELADKVLKTPSNSWWYRDPSDPHWVTPSANKKE